MEFCPKCGGILTVSRKSSEAVMLCRKCGYTKSAEGVRVLVNKGVKRKRAVATVVEGDEQELHPKTGDVECPSCGNREAFWWSVQTRSADEPSTQFFRCTRCGHTWREYA